MCGKTKRKKKDVFLKVLFQKIKLQLISHKYLGREGERDGAGTWPLPPLLFHTVL